MHYYKFNISDWTLHTAHLTVEEEGVYFRLVNHYYDTEQPIPEKTQSVIRRLRLGNNSDLVGLILEEYFTLEDGFWHHKRCDSEIELYQAQVSKNRVNGNKGGRPKGAKDKTKRVQKPKITQVVNSENPIVTLTTNHKPLTNNHNKDTRSLVSELPAPFDLFYQAYPRKQGKPSAQKAFKRLNPNPDLVQQIVTDIGSRISAGAWELDQKQFIPLPATYLNGEGWADEIIPRTSGPRKIDYSAMAREAQELIL